MEGTSRKPDDWICQFAGADGGKPVYNGVVHVDLGAPVSESTAWRRLSLLFFCSTLIESIAWGHLTAFTPILLQSELGVPALDVPRWTGLLAGSTLGLALPFAPFWGTLAERYGRKPIIVRSLIVEVIAFTLVATAPDLTTFFLARLLLGFSYGNVSVEMATQSLVTPAARIAAAIALVQAAHPIGSSVGPLLGGFISGWIGLRWVFGLDAGLLIIGLLLLLVGFRDTPQRNREPVRRQVGQTFRVVFELPAVRGLFLAAFLLAFGGYILDPFIPVRLVELHRAAGEPWLPTAAFVGTVLAGYGLLTGLTAPAMGALADRLGRWRLFGAAMLGLTLVSLAFALTRDLPLFVGFVLLRAFPQAVTIGIVYTLLVGELPRDRRTTVMALVPLPRNSAGFLAPMLAAALSIWGVSAIFASGAAVHLIAWGAVRRMAARARGRELDLTPRPLR